jgi:hypothetical protein
MADASTIKGNSGIVPAAYSPWTYPLAGDSALGGGLYVLGSANLTNVTVSSNRVAGGPGSNGHLAWISIFGSRFGRWIYVPAGRGGSAEGGGMFVGAGATVNLQGCSLDSNSAVGGNGGTGLPNGAGGAGEGGGMFVASGATVDLRNCVVNQNRAIGGQ